MERVLLIVSSCREMRAPAPGGLTGAWMEELAASYYAFVDAGCAVDIGSPLGAEGPIDPLSLQEPWLTSTGRRFQSDPVAMGKLRQTIVLSGARANAFDALYLVGGAAAAWDFPEDAHLARLVHELVATNRPVAAVCHGVLGLTAAQDAQGHSILRGRAATGVSNAEEMMTGFDKLVPLLPEIRLQALGANYSCAAPFEAHVVSDGDILTGQNPASAAPLALAVVARLRAQKLA